MRFFFNPLSGQINAGAPREIIYADTAPQYPLEGSRWFDTINLREYVYTGSEWVESGVGPSGVKGDTGVQGPVGPVGPIGATGPQGPAATIAVGAVTTGEPGTSVSVANSGTSGAAVLNFTIPRGAVGQTGAVGPQGPQGPQGVKGDVGNTGPQGIQGVQGLKGDAGVAGPAGAAASVTVGTTTTGNAGTNAAVTNSGTTSAAVLNFTVPRGATGATGAVGPQGPAGTSVVLKGSVAQVANLPTAGNAAGDLWVVTATGDGYVWSSTTNSWSNVGPIRGPAGATGATGAVGPAGTAATVSVGTTTTGSAGTNAAVTNSGTTSAAVFNFTIPRGATGAAGAIGPVGPVGPQGPQGIKGDTGNTGAQGPAGPAPAGTGAVVVSSGVLGTPVGYGATNVVNTLVQRDTSGNFSAGTITANLTGNASGSSASCTGNAATATKLATPRAINVSGDVTGTAQNFDGSVAITIPTAIAAGVIVNADINAAAEIADTKLATLSTAGKVSNSATTATNANTASAIVARDANGNFSATTITAALSGNASTASSAAKLTTARNINGTSFDGSADITISAAPTSHTHGNITNAGAIGVAATLPIITGANGVLQAGSFGTTAGTFCQGSDARLSDSRTPTAHTHGNITNAGAIGTTASLPIITGTSGVLQAGSFGTIAGTFCQGNDARLSDSRTPTSHTHGNITNAGAIGVAATLPIITGANGVLQAGSFGTIAGTFCEGNDARLSGTPAGAIMPFAMTTVPTGWLAANGAAVSRGTYSALFTAVGTTYGAGDGSTTFALPDLRGIFIRGSSVGTVDGIIYNGGNGGAVGARQTDAYPSHNHGFNDYYERSSANAVSNFSGGGGKLGLNSFSNVGGTTPNSTDYRGYGTETRPANIAFLYCIKF